MLAEGDLLERLPANSLVASEQHEPGAPEGGEHVRIQRAGAIGLPGSPA